MLPAEPLHIGYVVKRFPRYSETFIVTELLAHEAAGTHTLELFSLRPTIETHFQSDLARLRTPVRYVTSEGIRAGDFWLACQQAADVRAGLWQALAYASGEDVRDVYQALALAREVRLRGIDHLHAHFASLPATVARLAAHFAGISYSFTAHAKDIFVDGVNGDALARNLRDAALTVTVSDFNVQYLRSRFGPAAARVRRIYNGLDLTRFAFQPRTTQDPLVIAVGRLVEKKGFAALIDACAQLVARGRRFRCGIIGEGELEAELRDRIAARGVGEYVRLLGPRPSNEVAAAVGRAAVFAAPCVTGGDGNRDGLPTTVLESMAVGTPVVTTDVTGLPEAVTDGVSGLVVAQGDAAALAHALARLLDDQALAARLSATARRVVEQRFDSRVNAAALREAWSATRLAPAGAA